MKRTMQTGEKLEARNGCRVLRVAGVLSTQTVDSYNSIIIAPDFSVWLKNPVISRQHQIEDIIGVGRSISEADGVVRIEADILDDDAKTKITDGRLRGLSIGFDPKITFLRSDGITVYIRPTVAEVGICTLPSNPNCTIDTVACNDGVQK